MNPITPHLSEELNEKINEKNLSSTSSWPSVEIEKISSTAEAGEELIKVEMEGMRKVIQLAKLERPNKFTLFISEKWKYQLYEIISREIKITRNVGEIMRKVLEQKQMKIKGKEVSKIVQSVVKDISKLPSRITYQEEELQTMQKAKEFLEKEFNCTVEVINSDENDHPKAKSAIPGKVGILVE
jgi:leucyl-tRNA synthetase